MWFESTRPPLGATEWLSKRALARSHRIDRPSDGVLTFVVNVLIDQAA